MSPRANTEQSRYWNEEGGEAWVDEQSHMDRMLAPFADAVYEAADIRPGERVVDIGCGCGVTTLHIAEMVGETGTAVGLDISTPMIERARGRAAELGRGNAEFVVADAQSAELPAPPFDVIASRFGVMFFEDPTAAFANIRRAARADGRMAFVCWRTLAENDWASGVAGVLRDLLPPAPPPDPYAPGPFALADRDRVRSILDQSGWSDVRIEPLDRDMVQFAAGTLDDAVARSLRIGPGARALAGASDQLRAEAAVVVRDYLAAQFTPNGVISHGAVWLVTSRSAGG
jgi:SAM-dependent methyltransferase